MLVDIYGNPISSADFTEQQTQNDSRVGQLLRQYAEHPSEGLTPATLAQLLRRAEQGDLAAMADLAKDIEDKDGHVFSELSKRRKAWLKLDWYLEPPRNPNKQEELDTAAINEQLEDATWFTDLLFDLSDGILKGFSTCEIKREYTEKQHVVTGYDFRDQNLFITHPNDFNELRLNDSTVEGQALNPFGWVKHVHKSKSGYVHRAGLLSVLAWPYLFKNYSIRDLAEFLEIYGLPLRLGKYPSGASDTEKNTLLRAVLSIGHNAGGIIPKGMDIEFENAAQGQSDPFEAMIRWCELTQSKAILGATLTSQADGKTATNALGNVHADVLSDLVEADVRQLEQTITRDLIYTQHALNSKSYSGAKRMPKFRFDLSEAEDIQALAPALKTMVETGFQIPVSWVHEKTNIPEPQNGEAVLGLQPQAQNTQQSQAALKALAVLKASPPVEPAQVALDTALDALINGDMRDEYQNAVKPLLHTLRKSEELAAVEIATLLNTADSEVLTEYLTKLFFVAELWGTINE
ncbi:DUF935 domain-containing protein [Pseudoalteromonas phenolica]|uniref:DUF935 domain-containing protein n=1 Tax=Pseudoalteromonas phenolica TaxID=161398 RepID=UPI00110B5933|nr:DUF935 domain-containing protein [Pseudoalteromonas phenolica]TMO54098.1 hypothetical protein CWC21_16565 [Pseudoalteromonas phenolica]